MGFHIFDVHQQGNYSTDHADDEECSYNDDSSFSASFCPSISSSNESSESKSIAYIQSLTEDSSDSNCRKRKRRSNDELNKPLNKKRKVNRNENEIDFPSDIPLIITSSLKNEFGSKTMSKSDNENNEKNETVINYECNICEKCFFCKENLKKHLLIHKILESECNKYPKETDLLVEENKNNKIAWKQLLDGDPNTAKPLELRKKREKKVSNNFEKDNKCSTCHTYEAQSDGQCESCKNAMLGMPFCCNCDQRLSYNDYQQWMKENDIDKNDTFDMTQYLVLCQTCFVSV